MDIKFVILLNANLDDLVRDAWYIMRLRYRHTPIQYLYGLPVFLAVILGICVVNAVSLLPLLGNHFGAIAFGMLVGLTRFVVLSRVSRDLLPHAKTDKRLPYIGYVLAGEALTIPNLLVYAFAPLAFPMLLWNIWAFWAQALGFLIQSQQRPSRVIMMYLVYWVLSTGLIMVFAFLFFSVNWLDITQVQQNLKAILQTIQAH